MGVYVGVWGYMGLSGGMGGYMGVYGCIWGYGVRGVHIPYYTRGRGTTSTGTVGVGGVYGGVRGSMGYK